LRIDHSEGSFPWCRWVEGELNYYFYKKQGDGYVADKVDGDNAVVYMSDEAPHIDKVSVALSWGNLFFDPNAYKTKYLIYIPKGSIVENYKLDLD
jgi:hypothetical protein